MNAATAPLQQRPERIDRLASMTPSAIRAIHNLAERLKREDAHRRFIPLHVGEPDLGTPPFLVEAGCNALRAGAVFYENNAGRPDLIDALTGYYRERYDPRLTGEQFVVTCGGVQAICLTMLGLLAPGDDVVLFTPLWPNFREAALLAGAVVHEQPLRFDEDARVFRLDLDALEAAARRLPNLRMVIVNSPANPTGNVLTVAEKQALLAFTRARGVMLVADEMYDRINFVNDDPSFLTLREDADPLVVINGFSKTYAMTGWRLGYLIAQPQLAVRLGALQEFVTSHAPSMAQLTAVTALREGEPFIAESLTRYKGLRSLVLERLGSIPGIVTARPDGGFYAFFRHEATRDSMRFCEDLLRDTGLMIAPGEAFGAGAEGWVRLCFAKEAPVLDEALDRLESFLAARTA